MARADLILGVVRAASTGDEGAMRRTVEALIAEERAKHHHVLAERLEDALRSPSHAAFHVDGEERPGVDVLTPRRSLASLVLPAEVASECAEVIEEQQRIDLLRANGLEPRHRILTVGPPGNGKTSLAEAIAHALYVPLVRLRYDAIVGSFLGETSGRLAKAFDFVKTRRCVFFLDEFDAVAKERGDEHETGEIKRVVNTLLLLIDDLPSHVVLVAASNHPELLDRAVHRRFEALLRLDNPTHAQRTAFFDGFLHDFGYGTGFSSRRLADATEGASFSRLEQLTTDIRRRAILEPERDVRRLIEQRLRRMND